MSDNKLNNKRIAKNTLLLYIRMLVTMVISLFTSRVVLNTLGVEDFGIYNVVGGVVTLFTFVNNAMATGTQRHISYELGRKQGRVSEIFSACLRIHIFLGILVIMLGEIIGLWFLNTKLNIPGSRLYAANVIYQLALINCLLSIIKTPYDASVIAYEKMSFYAYMSIFSALSKLFMVYLLLIVPFDKLITYSVTILFICIIGFLIQLVYTHKKLEGIKFVRIKDKRLYKKLLSFSGWTLFGSITNMLETQGLNMIINIFFGVLLNAAVGVAGQVRGVLNQFVSGFQQALNPQLVMSESGGDRNRQFSLIYRSAKFSFFIMYALSLPIMANLHKILQIWLGQVPDYAAPICILIITLQMFECISSPLYTTIFAIGKIKTYQICVSFLRILSIISAFVICYADVEPYMIYVMPCVVAGLLLIYRIWFINKEIQMPIKSFLNKVIMPVLSVCIITILPFVAYKYYMVLDDSLIRFWGETAAITIFTILSIFTIGLTTFERAAIIQQVQKSFK